MWRKIFKLGPAAGGREAESIEKRRTPPQAENTAVNHCRNLYAKLGVHSRGELVAKVLSN
jgi:hypothetical protein